MLHAVGITSDNEKLSCTKKSWNGYSKTHSLHYYFKLQPDWIEYLLILWPQSRADQQ